MTGAVDIINSTLGKVGSNTLLGMLEEREYKLLLSWWSKYNIIDDGSSIRKYKLEAYDMEQL